MQKKTPWQINKPATDNWQTAQLAKQQNQPPAATTAKGNTTVVINPTPAPSGTFSGDAISFLSVPLVGTLAPGQAWYYNGTTLVPITVSTPSLEQALSGTVNGSNKTFTLTKSYPYGFVLYADGMRLLKGVDYTAASLPTVVCTNAPIQWIIADYF